MKINWKLLSFVLIATATLTSAMLVTNQLVMPLAGTSRIAEAHSATPHNTVHSESVIDNTLTAADLAANSVGASEIAADAVGASELQGVTKLLFGQCSPTATQKSASTMPQIGFIVQCSISGSDSDDSASATLNDTSHCFRVASADPASNTVNVTVKNECTFNASLGANSSIAVILYDK